MRLRARAAGRLVLALTVAVSVSVRGASDDEPEDDQSFDLSQPVVCKEIRGFGDFDPLPRASVTKDEKLLIYFNPRHFKTERVGKKYQAHFTEGGRIRRRGQKAVLWSRDKLLELKSTYDQPPRGVFIRNTISVKQLTPGEYDFEVTLHDMVGQSPPATRTVPFRVVPTPEGAGETKDDEPGRPEGRSVSKE